MIRGETMIWKCLMFAVLPLACFLAAGCAEMSGLQSGLSGAAPKPKIVLVSDFAFAPEVVAIDRGYTARLERKVGAYPAYQRRQRTSERVNDEIVATIIVSLRESGLDAQPGGEDTLTADQSALVVAGSLRPAEAVTDKNKNSFGFGPGRGHVVAVMNASLFSPAGRHELQTFNVQPAAAKREPPVPPKVAAARNASIASVVAALGSPGERLSPDVEATARRLGRAAAERVIVLAKEQGWIGAPETKPPVSPPAAPAPPGDEPAPAEEGGPPGT